MVRGVGAVTPPPGGCFGFRFTVFAFRLAVFASVWLLLSFVSLFVL
jgi:hypothetical protein